MSAGKKEKLTGTQLELLPKKPARMPARGRRNMRYPWADWFRRKEPFTLTKGEDYFAETSGMMQMIRNAAGPRRYNCKVSISIAEDDQSLTVLVERGLDDPPVKPGIKRSGKKSSNGKGKSK